LIVLETCSGGTSHVARCSGCSETRFLRSINRWALC
jgi:hypothetical protein